MVGTDAGEGRRDEAQGGEEVKSKPAGEGLRRLARRWLSRWIRRRKIF